MYYKARRLSQHLSGAGRLLPAYASSNIEVYPYQIAAALFALRSSYLKGTVLCDEGSLGKTYEALLVATQMRYEGKDRQLLILPTNLIHQWAAKIESGFSLPFCILDTEEALRTYREEEPKANPFERQELVVTTYDFAVERADLIREIQWDLVIFDEASCLSKGYTGQNKTAATLKEATAGAYRLLLTPTPIELSIMDVYGLIHFIDESVLPDANWFYNRYFRKPENYPELTEWVSRYCFRTLKSQVGGYVNFTQRIPHTISYELTEEERALYALLDEYLSQPRKLAYPQMKPYDLTLLFYHTVSSSPQALARTIDGAIKRVETLPPFLDETLRKRELAQLGTILEKARAISTTGKGQELVSVLKSYFAQLKKMGVPTKAVVFVENLTTQKHLHTLLSGKGFANKVLLYNGTNSRDPHILDRFRNDKAAQILLTTDEAARGLDMEFCPVVINYDLLYNAIQLEQRISRCHRQGQRADVFAVNLLCKENFADVRILELINKRVLQFGGIFGLSDDLLGNFDTDTGKVLTAARKSAEIEQAFADNLSIHRSENEKIVDRAEQAIFTTFTRQIAETVTVAPQYIRDKTREINEDLWEIARFFFAQYNQSEEHGHFEIDEQARTITAEGFSELPWLFYYWTGGRSKRYRSLKAYGMPPDFKPRTGQIVLTSRIASGMMDNLYCENSGSITVDGDIEPCTIELYSVTVALTGRTAESEEFPYYVFTGQTQAGRVLKDEECQEIMRRPVLDWTENRDGAFRNSYASRQISVGGRRGIRLEKQIDTDFYLRKWEEEHRSQQESEADFLRHQTAVAKAGLERALEDLRAQIRQAEQTVDSAADRLQRMKAEKGYKVLKQELKKKEEALFLDKLRLDAGLEERLAALTDKNKLAVRLDCQYSISVRSVE